MRSGWGSRWGYDWGNYIKLVLGGDTISPVSLVVAITPPEAQVLSRCAVFFQGTVSSPVSIAAVSSQLS